MKKRLLAGLLATSIALSISMGAFPAMAATNDDFVEDREDIADYTDDSYSSGYSSSEQLFDDIIFFDLDEEVDDTAAEVIAEEDANDSSDTEIDRAADSIEETEPEMRQKKKWMTTLRCWLPEKPWRTKTTHTPMCRLVQSTWWTSTRTTRQKSGS